MMTTATRQPNAVWIIQNIQGDYNDEYYTPRATTKFFLTREDACKALVPFHRHDARRNKVAKHIERSADPDGLWAELVAYLHFPTDHTPEELAALSTKLGVQDVAKLLKYGDGNFRQNEFRILKLTIDAETPCAHPYLDSYAEDLRRGLITQDEYDQQIKGDRDRWWDTSQ